MARVQEMALPRGNRGLLVLAVVAGLAAAALVFVALASGGDDGGSTTVTPGAGTSKVVVAAQSIPASTKVTADMLKVVEVPNNLLVSDAYTDTAPVVGDVTSVVVAAGEQITPAKLGTFIRELNTTSSVLQPSTRGVAASVQEVTAVGGLIFPGDRVDLVATYNIWLTEDTHIQRTEVILQNVEVLSVGQQHVEPRARPNVGEGQASSDASDSSGTLPEDVTEQPEAGTLTVALNPQDALKLTSYQDSPATVRIWAVLRGFGDKDTPEIAPHEVIIHSDKVVQ